MKHQPVLKGSGIDNEKEFWTVTVEVHRPIAVEGTDCAHDANKTTPAAGMGGFEGQISSHAARIWYNKPHTGIKARCC